MRSQKGIAIVLVITLMGLLSSLGLYLILGSNASYRMTKAMQRSESAFNLAEAATQLSLRCISKSVPFPSFEQLNSSLILPIKTGLPYYMKKLENLGGVPGTSTPTIDYVGYKTIPPVGWMLNWQGSSSFTSLYLRAKGHSEISLRKIAQTSAQTTTQTTTTPSSPLWGTAQNPAQATVTVLVLKITK